MAHGRHRPHHSPARRAGVAFAVVALAGGVGYAGVRYVAPTIRGGCGSNVPVLPVSAAPDIAPAIAQVANRWNETKPSAGGQCVRAQVSAVAPDAVVNALTAQYASGPKPSASPSTATASPVVWIPDSMSWVDRVRAYNTNAFADLGPSVASSRLVIAARADGAESLGLGGASITPKALITLLHAMRDGDLTGHPTKFQLGVADPAHDAVGFATAQLLASIDSGKQDGLPKGGALIADYRFIGPIGQDSHDSATLMSRFGSRAPGWQPMTAAVVSEQAVVAHNLAGGADAYKALALSGVGLALDYPVVTVDGASPNLTEAAASFVATLSTPASQQIFVAHGFRSSNGTAASGFPVGHGAGASPASKPAQIRYDKTTAPVIDLWAAANEQAQVLTLVDVASSMGSPSGYGALSRLAMTATAAGAGLKLFTPGSAVGLLGFAPGISKDGYAELVPLGALSQNGDQVLKAFQNAKPTAATGCALYPALAAAYKRLRDSYVSGEINTVVAFTDCADPAPGGMSKSALLNSLQNMADPANPIRVVLINVGGPANDQNLNDIAGTVGGSAVRLTAPQQITAVFMGALVALS
jgi:Ca-activated chloride channel homolog